MTPRGEKNNQPVGPISATTVHLLRSRLHLGVSQKFRHGHTQRRDVKDSPRRKGLSPDRKGLITHAGTTGEFGGLEKAAGTKKTENKKGLANRQSPQTRGSRKKASHHASGCNPTRVFGKEVGAGR